MKFNESIGDFYQRHGQGNTQTGQFTVFRIEEMHRAAHSPHNRRDFYKVMLLTEAEGMLLYADKSIAVHSNALVFSNPLVPYSWERVAGSEAGYVCLFTEDFINPQLKTEGVAGSPLFKLGGHPVLFPPLATIGFLRSIFEQMLAEMQSGYVNKHELLRNYVQIILHESLKIAPTELLYQPGTSSARITSLFLELLARQFPITTPQHGIRLKNASEFARQLSVHTNHLNKALKEITGKTTTEHIAEKLLQEAKALLRHSDWSIADVGYSLGFEHAANFIIFFNRQTGQTPNHFRKQPLAIS